MNRLSNKDDKVIFNELMDEFNELHNKKIDNKLKIAGINL